MARAKKDEDPAAAVEQTVPAGPVDVPADGAGADGEPSAAAGVEADGGDGAKVADDNDNRSSETQVVLPAEDEPVRFGGHILTEDGWVVEDHVPDPHDSEQE